MQNILIPLRNSNHTGSWETFIKAILQRTNSKVTILFYGSSTQIKQQGSLLISSSTQKSDLQQFAKRPKDISFLYNSCKSWLNENTEIEVVFYGGSLSKGVEMLSQQQEFDLLIWAPKASRNYLTAYWDAVKTTRIIGSINIPVCVIPSASQLTKVDHISYAVDLRDYDPGIIKQVKQIARIFDAKLTLVHVNMNGESGETYVNSLERTISDTLDYPKVHYRFFDHHDISKGIRQFVDLNNTNLVALTNRKRINWRDMLSARSLTFQMVQQLPIPLIAFRKYST